MLTAIQDVIRCRIRLGPDTRPGGRSLSRGRGQAMGVPVLGTRVRRSQGTPAGGCGVMDPILSAVALLKRTALT